MRNSATRSFVVLLLISFAACGEDRDRSEVTGSGDRSGSTSYDGTWELVEGTGPKGEVAIIDGYRVTLVIEGERISGTSACNSYFADAAIDGTSFSVPGVGSTEMACRRDVMEAEAAYVSALTEVHTIRREQNFLMLTGNDADLRFEFVPPIPTADLVDTQWRLETLIYGTGTDGIAASAEPAELLLNSDGTITGTTGCRDLYGEWTESGDEIAFSTFGAKGNCPDQLREQDGHVVSVLGDGFRPTIEENRLTVIGRGDLGLQYRAKN